MNIQEIFHARKVQIQEERRALDIEETQIDHALDALAEDTTIKATSGETPIKKEDAVLQAVKSGKKRPQDIHTFLKRKLDVTMNLGSVRSTLSRLKSEGRINRDASGWVM